MIGISSGPSRLPIQWGSKGILDEEIKYRTRPKSWRTILFGALAVFAFMIILFVLDFLG